MAFVATTIAAIAVTGAAAVGAGATVYAANKGASATESAANTAANEQQAALQQQEALAAPYTGVGQAAIPQYEALLGLTGSGGTAQPTGTIGPNGQVMQGTPSGPGIAGVGNAGYTPANTSTLAALEATPGYQFTLSQGLQGVSSQAAAAGMLNSGNTLEALDQYGSGLADQTYQQAVGNAQNAVGIGQAAAAGQAANIGQAASNEGSIALNEGNTLASFDANEAAGLTSAVGNASNALVLQNTLAGLSSPASSGWSTGLPDYAAG